MVDTLKDIGPGDIILTPAAHFKVYKLDSRARARIFYRTVRHDGKAIFDHYHFSDGTRAFMAEVLPIKGVPTTWTGPATSKQCTFYRLARFLNGNRAMYDAWLASRGPSEYFGGTFDASVVTVAADPDKSTSLVNTRRFKKLDLICAVLMAHGPLHKDDVLRRVAVLEGKPWMKGSNGDYFTIAKQHQGCLEHCGKDGQRVTHWLTEAGVIRGSQVLAEVGIDLVKGLP